MNNVFYPGYVSAHDQELIKSSPAWELVTGINTLSKGGLMAYDLDPNFAVLTSRITMCTHLGQKSLRIDVVNDISVGSRSKYMHMFYVAAFKDNEWITIIRSNKPRYILKKLAEVRDGRKHKVRKRAIEVETIGDSLEEFVKTCDHEVHREVAHVVYDLIGTRYSPSAYYHPMLSNERVYELLELYAGEVTSLQLSPDARACFDKEIASIKGQTEAHTKLMSELDEIFGADKHLVIVDDSAKEKVIVGAVNLRLVVADVATKDNPFRATVPPTNVLRDMAPISAVMYKSLAVLPDDIKNRLYSAMTFVRVMSGRLSKVTAVDPDAQLYDAGSVHRVYDLLTGTTMIRSKNSTIYLFNK